jgi:hypothetical protein
LRPFDDEERSGSAALQPRELTAILSVGHAVKLRENKKMEKKANALRRRQG